MTITPMHRLTRVSDRYIPVTPPPAPAPSPALPAA